MTIVVTAIAAMLLASAAPSCDVLKSSSRKGTKSEPVSEPRSALVSVSSSAFDGIEAIADIRSVEFEPPVFPGSFVLGEPTSVRLVGADGTLLGNPATPLQVQLLLPPEYQNVNVNHLFVYIVPQNSERSPYYLGGASIRLVPSEEGLRIVFSSREGNAIYIMFYSPDGSSPPGGSAEPPEPPTEVVVQPGGNSTAIVSWKPVLGASSYVVGLRAAALPPSCTDNIAGLPTTASFVVPEVTPDLWIDICARIDSGSLTLYSAPVSASLASAATSMQGVAAPTFTVLPGTDQTAQVVTLRTATELATIYYTTENGTNPTLASIRYQGEAVTIGPETPTLRAFAVRAGYIDSTFSSITYTVMQSDPHGGTVSSTTSTTLQATPGTEFQTINSD